ncbi:MAG: hypothetical protein A3J18_03210 [Candidatus Levybacteria bacterium RIFCSPLOWO2_02_FULL_40_18]|nr:MAG: hypothetical protein UV63_C0058G0007 [Microgenomates group bacterium GW2011_GWC1_43_11]OGH49720.1 MAG: hypothetical protein A3J18_03210 [Candidatus Levybacteria bacterium RIFCSPLOWO2_02_FULL_40_18]OGH70691.1 MAG: hypothetical protein A2396_00715 [Candidatus Levybacteria bacterium RIFOXYB1_FULL_40_17]
MSKKDAVKFVILRSIGNFLLIFALFGVVATFGPALYYEASFRLAQFKGVKYEVSEMQTSPLRQVLKGDSPGFGDLLNREKRQILVPPSSEFSILIPKIGASARIFPNIDPSNKELFLPILQEGVAHAEGTVFPGMGGNVYLFAHSTDNFWDVGRYNAIFYLLKDLAPGDEVVVFFEGVRHNYVVSGSQIVDAEDVSLLTEAQGGEEQLILQTCWPPGTTWKRLLVFAKPK